MVACSWSPAAMSPWTVRCAWAVSPPPGAIPRRSWPQVGTATGSARAGSVADRDGRGAVTVGVANQVRGCCGRHLALSVLGECSRARIEEGAQPVDGALDAIG